jgi:hypothetical protein
MPGRVTIDGFQRHAELMGDFSIAATPRIAEQKPTFRYVQGPKEDQEVLVPVWLRKRHCGRSPTSKEDSCTAVNALRIATVYLFTMCQRYPFTTSLQVG